MIQFIVVASLAFTNVLASFGTIQPAQYAVDDLHVDFGEYVDVTSSQWLLSNVLGDEVTEWDVLLEMSGDFQFSSSSYINVADFQINDECVTKECDLYFGFGVDSKYFTLVTDQDGSYNNGHELYGIQIYPGCGGSLASGDVSTIVAKNRRNALAGGSYENWDQMGGSVHNNGDDTWPVTIEIKNNALSNEVTVTFLSATQELECVYSDSFDQDTDTVFGMIGDANDDGEQLKITTVTIAEENVDICEGMCESTAAGRQGPVHIINQVPSTTAAPSYPNITFSDDCWNSFQFGDEPWYSPDGPYANYTHTFYYYQQFTAFLWYDTTSYDEDRWIAGWNGGHWMACTQQELLDCGAGDWWYYNGGWKLDTDCTVAAVGGDASSAHMASEARHQGPVHMVNQGPSSRIGGSEDVNAEPFSIALSAKDLVIAVLAAMTVILMVVICVLNRKGGVGMSRKYKVVSVAGDSEMEEFQE